MTNREFFVAISKCADLTADLREHAQAQLSKMDASNAKNRGKESKTYKANLPLMAEVLNLLAIKPMLTSEVAQAMTSENRSISTSKASGLLRTLEAEGKVTSTKVKVKGKGEQTQYTIVLPDEVGEDDAVQATDWELNTMY
jgi:hypothetical protein